MKKWIIIIVLTSFFLTACGVKGNLYFPEKEKTPPISSVKQNNLLKKT